MKRGFRFLVALMIVAVFSGCFGNSAVKMLKNGYLEDREDVTVGEVFDSVFRDLKWTQEDGNRPEIVFVKAFGIFTDPGSGVQIPLGVSFEVDTDSETWQVNEVVFGRGASRESSTYHSDISEVIDMIYTTYDSGNDGESCLF